MSEGLPRPEDELPQGEGVVATSDQIYDNAGEQSQPEHIEIAYHDENAAQPQSDQPSETAPEASEPEPEQPTAELEHSIDHDNEPTPERKKGDVYQNEAGKWTRFDGMLTADSGVEVPNESDVTDEVERKGLEWVKEHAKYSYDRGGRQLQQHDDYFVGTDKYVDRLRATRRLSLDEARMQADLLQMDRSEKVTREDGSEYATGFGPFGYAHPGRDGDRVGDNMDRRTKYMQLHKEIDPQLAEIQAEEDEMERQWQAEHGPRSLGFIHSEEYRVLQERRRELEKQVPEGESDYNGREYQEKILAEKLDERAEFVNQQVHEIFNLNPERFASMPAGEFLKVTEDYNKWQKYHNGMEWGSRMIDTDLTRIQKIIDEGGQATAVSLNAEFNGSIEQAGYRLQGEDVQAAITFRDEIINGFNDRAPSETYRMMIEFGQKLKAAYEDCAKNGQDRLNKLVAGEDAAEEPGSEKN